jgi:hypothetical protein
VWDFKEEDKHMAGKKDKVRSKNLDLDVKKTSPARANDQSGELGDEDLNKVAAGQKRLRTITCDDECDSYACETMVGCA